MIKTTIGILAVFLSTLSICWAQTNLDRIVPLVSPEISETDLDLLLNEAGAAKIIALSEATHGKNEPLNFRNALVKALVTRKLINVIALESGTNRIVLCTNF
jgi:erythromycin esterase-like protein